MLLCDQGRAPRRTRASERTQRSATEKRAVVIGGGALAHADVARAWRGTILQAVGDTPLIQVDGIWAKLEYLNPSGSIKARLAAYP